MQRLRQILTRFQRERKERVGIGPGSHAGQGRGSGNCSGDCGKSGSCSHHRPRAGNYDRDASNRAAGHCAREGFSDDRACNSSQR